MFVLHTYLLLEAILKRIIVVDTETSGLSAKVGGRVIEVGAVEIEDGYMVSQFEMLINTGAVISYSAYQVHGISEAMLRGQPSPDYAWKQFCNFVGDSTLVAHNATFDSTFIKNEFNLLGLTLQNKWNCTLKLARQRLPNLPNHRLETVYRHLFKTIPKSVNRHRALDDAKLAAAIWVKLVGDV